MTDAKAALEKVKRLSPEGQRQFIEDLITSLAEKIEAQETALASITRERDEAREVSRITTRFYPFGENAHRDHKLTQALLAVTPPSARAAALVNGEVGE